LQLAAEEKKDPLAWALCGGEDYELLFTAPPSRHDDILALCASIHVDTPIHIGSIVEGDTVYLESAGTRAPLPDKGYHHFSSP
jgi:thiamine-monophosphate kinase